MKLKFYTVKEFAEKLRVSEGLIYDKVKTGEIKKKEGMGRRVIIPASELKVAKKKSTDRFGNIPEGVHLITTSLGEVRMIDDEYYLLTDVALVIGVVNTWTIYKAVSNDKCFRKMTRQEAHKNGIETPDTGAWLINIDGLEIYSKKSKKNIDWNSFLSDLNYNFKYRQEHFEIEEEKKENNLPVAKVFEGHEVEIIQVNGEILFEIYSTGMALGYLKWNGEHTHCNARKDRIDKVIENAEIKPFVQNGRKYFTESQLYDFMLEAKTDKCKSFRKWVTTEVLPTIRKTGGYVNNEDKFVDNYFSNLAPDIKKILKKDLSNKILEAEIKKKEIDIEKKKLDDKKFECDKQISEFKQTLKKLQDLGI